jgi:hypothetical protein
MFDLRPNLQHPPLLEAFRGLHFGFEQAICSLRGLEKSPPYEERQDGFSFELRAPHLIAGGKRRPLHAGHAGGKPYGE